jgi:hypothetical protein
VNAHYNLRKKVYQLIQEEFNDSLMLQRAQQGHVDDGYDFREFDGQHGTGIYAFFYGDKEMEKYYTSNNENVHTFTIPKKYVLDLSNKNYAWKIWDVKKIIYDHPDYKAFIFKHAGSKIPTSKEILITDPSIITIIKKP